MSEQQPTLKMVLDNLVAQRLRILESTKTANGSQSNTQSAMALRSVAEFLAQQHRLLSTIAPVKVNMFDAEMTARPKGEHIGWVALYNNNSEKRDWFQNPSISFANAMFATGRYEWVRRLHFDGQKYYIAA